MFNKLQQKWNVGGKQFFWILCVFAVTGTTTAYLTKVITSWAGFTDETSWIWKLLLRLGMLVIGYQVILMIVAFIFGQFPFFWRYEKKMLTWLGILDRKSQGAGYGEEVIRNRNKCVVYKGEGRGKDLQRATMTDIDKKSRMAVFASGTGSNAEKIIDYFKNHHSLQVALIVSNKADAGVLKIAEREKITSLVIEKGIFFRGDAYVDELKNLAIDWIVLAGFLWKVPLPLIQAFPGKIINIHPALLPKYGGKGMYGRFVHEAVLAAGDRESGITIHYVDEHFDHGKHILQVTCPVEHSDTPDTLAKKIQTLEHKYYPEIIEKLILEYKA